MRDRPDELLGLPAAVRALAGIMVGDADPAAVLQRTCQVAKDVITAAADISVTMIDQRTPRTVASSGELATTVDERQYELGAGPCLQAARDGVAVVVSDAGKEARWPGYGQAALEAGVRGSMSVPLAVDGNVVGALNVYSTRTASFDEAAVDTAADLARYAGMVLNATDGFHRATTLVEQMQQAMESRAVIEQAKGIVMAQRRCAADEAFEALVRISQESHRKLREIAEALVEQIAKG